MKTNTNTHSICNLINNDCANFACLLDLLVEHPDIQSHKILMGSANAIKERFLELWEKIDLEIDNLDQELAA